jgi:hypothetical protein
MGDAGIEGKSVQRFKVKLSCYAMQKPRGEDYSSYSFTSALDGVSGQRQAPAALYTILTELPSSVTLR